MYNFNFKILDRVLYWIVCVCILTMTFLSVQTRIEMNRRAVIRDEQIHKIEKKVNIVQEKVDDVQEDVEKHVLKQK